MGLPLFKSREIQIGLKKGFGYNVPGSTAIAAGGSGAKAAEPLRPTCFIYYIVSSRERRKKNRYTDFTLGNTAATVASRRRIAGVFMACVFPLSSLDFMTS